MTNPNTGSNPNADSSSISDALLRRIRLETEARNRLHDEINRRCSADCPRQQAPGSSRPKRMRLNSWTGEWELRLDGPDEGPGPYLDGPKIIYGDDIIPEEPKDE